jgi:hypothetical protein
MKFNQNETTPSVPSSKAAGVGGQTLLDGPLDLVSFPKQKGSSSGKNGMKLKLMYPEYNGSPITQRAKSK